ncbi:MAG: glycosyltransferase family 39 protein [Chloroflexota bacterium]
MTRKQIIVDGAVVATVGLLFQLIWAWQLPLPRYMDSYYYTTNGQQIASGAGLNEEIIWQFLDEPTRLPVPSHSYWMPLPSFLAASGYLFSDSFRAAQAPFWFMSGLLPLLAYWIGQQLGLKRWQCLSGALFTAAGGFYAGWLNQPATFAPFAWFGGLCLLQLIIGVTNGKWHSWVLAGVLAGLAHLTRADGLLFLITAVFIIFLTHWQKKSGWMQEAGLLTAGYLLAMGGWFVRNMLIWQRPLPTAGTQTIFLTTYDDLFAYGRSFDLNHLLEWGWGNIISSRLDALSLSIQTFIAINSLIFLFPFVVWGWFVLFRKKRQLVLPWTVYAIGLYVAMTFVFTFPGMRGGLFHSSIAIWPFCMIMAPVGIEQAVNAVAKRLPHWQPERAMRLFTGLFVVTAFVMTTALTVARQNEEDVATAVYQEIGTMLPTDSVVMVGNAPHFFFHTGLNAVSIPNEPLPILLDALEAFRVDYLILDANTPVPLLPLYQMEQASPQINLLQQMGDYQLYEIIQ